jgi:hypothetical protein
MINYELIKNYDKELQEWLFNLSNYEQALKDRRWAFQKEWTLPAKHYDEAFRIAIKLRRKLKLEIQITEFPDKESFTLIGERTRRQDTKTIKFTTYESVRETRKSKKS